MPRRQGRVASMGELRQKCLSLCKRYRRREAGDNHLGSGARRTSSASGFAIKINPVSIAKIFAEYPRNDAADRKIPKQRLRRNLPDRPMTAAGNPTAKPRRFKSGRTCWDLGVDAQLAILRSVQAETLCCPQRPAFWNCVPDVILFARRWM